MARRENQIQTRIPEQEAELLRIAHTDPDQASFHALIHFAKRGEEWALEILNDNWHRYGPLPTVGSFHCPAWPRSTPKRVLR